MKHLFETDIVCARLLMKKLLVCLLSMCWACSLWAAPVVVVPGDAASYMYFPAGVEVDSSNSTAEPVGFIGMFPADPPDGWLACDGTTINAAQYPDLVLYITGNPSAAAAVLPDMRAVFLRGWDNGRGLDSGRALNSIQADQNLSHGHAVSGVSSAGNHGHTLTLTSAGSHAHRLVGSQFVSNSVDSNHMDRTGSSYLTNNPNTSSSGAHAHAISSISTDGAHTHAITTTTSGGTAAKPRNFAVIFAIKAVE